jgi:hypothetical protein
MSEPDPRLYLSGSKAATRLHCPMAPASAGLAYENAIHLILLRDEVGLHRWRLVPRTVTAIDTIPVRQQRRIKCLLRCRIMRAVTMGMGGVDLLGRKAEVII